MNVFLLTGLITIMIPIRRCIIIYRFKKRCLGCIDGTIIDYNVTEYRNKFDLIRQYEPIYEYEISGVKYHGVYKYGYKNVRNKRYKPPTGRLIKLRYDKKDPSIICPEKEMVLFDDVFWMTIFFILILFCFAYS